jgi:uncharacterized protein (TIGR03435 family)
VRKGFLLACIFLIRVQGANAPTFDVASILPQAPDDTRFEVKMPSAGRFSANGVVAKLVIMLAYDVQESQIAGGPNWLTTDKWNITAKSNDGLPHSVEETRAMLQNMLAERFGLRVHRETELRPAYVLTVAKSGPKFKARSINGPKDDRSTNVRVTSHSISLESGELARMTQLLSAALGRPVVDRTGLNGIYDLSLEWDDAPMREGGVPGLDAPTAPGNEHGSIFTAIQDQLGLRLEPERVPVEVIVVDRMEMPSPIVSAGSVLGRVRAGRRIPPVLHHPCQDKSNS